MGEANEYTRLDLEDAKVLPAREALWLISGGRSDVDEERSGGSEEPPERDDGVVEGV
jgi:hypothetical protein